MLGRPGTGENTSGRGARSVPVLSPVSCSLGQISRSRSVALSQHIVRRFLSGLLGSVLLLAVIALPRLANAGGAIDNSFGIPRSEDGRGLKVGERSTFHAGLALGFGFDSNAYSNAKSETKVPAAFTYPSAWLGIGNRDVRDGLLMSPAERTGRWLDYNIGLLAGFRQYLASSQVTRSIPRVSGGLQLRFVIAPGRRFSVSVDDDLFYGSYAGNYQALGSLLNFSRFENRGQVVAYLRPGGGRLSFGAGYRNQFLVFVSPKLFRGNRMVNGLYHETKWRFLPRSAVVLTYTMDFTYYSGCCVRPGNGRKEDNWAHRLLVGYRGQVVDKLALEAMAGWGAGFYRQDHLGPEPDFNSFIGQAGVSYYPTLRSLVHVGVYRNFSDSLLGNYFVDNGGRLSFGHQFRWRMIGYLAGNLAARRYVGLSVPGGNPGGENDDIEGYQGPGADKFQRDTVIVGLEAKLEQPLGKFFALSLGYNMLADTRPFTVVYEQTNFDGENQTDDISYVKHLVNLFFSVRI